MRPLLNLPDNQPLLFPGQWFPRPSGAGWRGRGVGIDLQGMGLGVHLSSEWGHHQAFQDRLFHLGPWESPAWQ